MKMNSRLPQKRNGRAYGRIAIVCVIAPFLCIIFAVIAAEPFGVSAELGSSLGLIFVSLLLLLAIVVAWAHRSRQRRMPRQDKVTDGIQETGDSGGLRPGLQNRMQPNRGRERRGSALT